MMHTIMRYNYTDTFRSTLELATDKARELGLPEVSLDLLLWGILREGTSSAIKFLSDRELSPQTLLQLTEALLRHPKEEDELPHSEPTGAVLYSLEAHSAIARAAEICTILGDHAISPLHLLLSIIFCGVPTVLSGFANVGNYDLWSDPLIQRIGKALKRGEKAGDEVPASEGTSVRIRPIQAIEVSAKGITPIALGDDLPPIQAFVRRAEGSIDIEGDFLSQLMNRAKRELGRGGGEEPRADMDEFPFAEFGVDLVEHVRAQEQGSTEGLERQAEIEQLLQILLRYKACSPILIGEPKVGKTEVVRQLARLIARGEGLPEAFPYKHILQVSFTRLFAGAQFMGGAEATIRSLMENLRAAPDVLLFVDDLHLLRSGGRAPGGEVLDTLFAALDLSGLRLIGTATSSGYTQSLDDSSQMERVCYPVLVEPLSRERTLAVLREKSRQYEEHYGADLQPLLERVLDLSERYMPALPFPYKALELLDATGAVVLARMPERGTKTKGRGASRPTAPIYTEADVDRALSRLTSLPLERISGTNELKHLIELPHRLKASVLGQDRAVEAIARAIQRSRLGLRDSRRPIASMLFLGPTGVGKTYLAKALAREVFGREDAMVRIDMSEFSERFAVSRLIGSPPGYIGYGEGGELTQPVRTRPYSLVLLDEIEKAHPDTYNILLQVFEDGRLTDTEGNVVDFCNTIVIMTSNVGSRQAQAFARGVGFAGLSDEAERSERISRQALQRTFSPEFLNRLDEIIAFEPLSDEALVRIFELELTQLRERVSQQGYRVTVSPEARRFLALRELDRAMGARPLRRTLQHAVEDQLLNHILDGSLAVGDSLSITLGRNQSLRYAVQHPPLKAKSHT